MYKKSTVHYMTKVCVDFLFYLGIVCCILVPFSKPWLTKYFGFIGDTSTPMLIILLLTGILSVYILYQLKIMFKTLLVGNPFINDNVVCFRKISLASAFISLIYLFKCFIYFTLSTVVIIAIFIIASLFSLTLKDLFKQAIYFKEENDLTV